jgi:uncharacterized membrane protein YdbT with pleckstrin-like domain
MNVMEEKIVYRGCPSQIRNLGPFLLAGILAGGVIGATIATANSIVLVALLLPLAYTVWKWLEIRHSQLTITDQRIIVTHGVLNKITNETELYRVRDTSVVEPLFLRLFGLGHIVVYTTDEQVATHYFKAYEKPQWVKDQIRNYAEICRQKKRWGNDNILLQDQFEGNR